jgi:hypothetical protein
MAYVSYGVDGDLELIAELGSYCEGAGVCDKGRLGSKSGASPRNFVTVCQMLNKHGESGEELGFASTGTGLLLVVVQFHNWSFISQPISKSFRVPKCNELEPRCKPARQVCHWQTRRTVSLF